MGMFDMMQQGAAGAGQSMMKPMQRGIRAQPQGGIKQMGGGIGPSIKSQMMNKGQQGMRMGQQMPMKLPQMQGGPDMRPDMRNSIMPQKQMPDLSQYAQQGQQQPAQWNQPLPETSSQMRQPMGPSPNGLQELLARMQMGNTGINGGGSPIEMNRQQMMNKRMPQY